jgi:hypothetical protein
MAAMLTTDRPETERLADDLLSPRRAAENGENGRHKQTSGMGGEAEGSGQISPVSMAGISL